MEPVGYQLRTNEIIFISDGLKDRVIKVTKDEHMDVCEMQCSQEEADTRIVLHASIASNKGA